MKKYFRRIKKYYETYKQITTLLILIVFISYYLYNYFPQKLYDLLGTNVIPINIISFLISNHWIALFFITLIQFSDRGEKNMAVAVCLTLLLLSFILMLTSGILFTINNIKKYKDPESYSNHNLATLSIIMLSYSFALTSAIIVIGKRGIDVYKNFSWSIVIFLVILIIGGLFERKTMPVIQSIYLIISCIIVPIVLISMLIYVLIIVLKPKLIIS